jgi:hypothetical protein
MSIINKFENQKQLKEKVKNLLKFDEEQKSNSENVNKTED